MNSRITHDLTVSMPPNASGGLTLEDLRALVDAASDVPGTAILRARVAAAIFTNPLGSPVLSITVPAPAAEGA